VDIPKKRLEYLFEEFLRNFCSREQDFHPVVNRQCLRWADAKGDGPSLGWLPRMETDICLASPEEKLIVDAKFYVDPFTRGRHDGRERLRSAHIYQLLAYVKNIPREPEQTVAGMLVYAKTGEETTARIEIQGHRIVVATVDLTRSPDEIRDRLTALVVPREELAIA
jgi:5-methylcytosine-specific restriction enzyme subunit McrC